LLQELYTIPPFGILIKKIKIASFRHRLILQRYEEEEMRFIKQNTNTKNFQSFLPIIPLVRIKLPIDDKDKSAFITFELKVRAGTGAGTPSYKKNMRTFEEGSPQEWMDVLTGLREIWKQNSVVEPTDQAATIAAILKGDSLTAFDSALEDARNPEDTEEVDGLVDMTLEHIEMALRSVTEIVFPFRALEIQKQWMTRYLKKPYDLSTKKTAAALSRLNNYLPLFPLGTPASKYSESELIGLLEFALPNKWRNLMDLKGFVPADNDYKTFVDECERIERNETVVKRDRNNNNDDDDDDNKNNKKVKFAKNKNDRKINGGVRVREEDEHYCTKCGVNKTHDTARCYILKREAREKEAGHKGKAHAKPYSARTFRKEVNALARRAGKNDGLKIVESALKREKGKKASLSSKKQAKRAVARKHTSDVDDTSDDESMHNMEQRIPRKKTYKVKTVRINSKAEVVDTEDSDDDRKMPAKANRKKPPKVVIDSSSDEDEDNKPTKEELAFLKSIAKKEREDQESD
jgi:hypothetical protein